MSYFQGYFSDLDTYQITIAESPSTNKLKGLNALTYNKPSKKLKISMSIASYSLTSLEKAYNIGPCFSAWGYLEYAYQSLT